MLCHKNVCFSPASEVQNVIERSVESVSGRGPSFRNEYANVLLRDAKKANGPIALQLVTSIIDTFFKQKRFRQYTKSYPG